MLAKQRLPSALPFLRRYTRLGYAVFPCQGKRPLTPNGLHDATLDEVEFRDWLRYCPKANWGLLPPSEVLVLDVDEPTGVERWQVVYPELRAVPLCRTPRGGAHLYLRLPPEAPVLKVRGLPDGSHLRGLGRAYLVAPPSRTEHGVYRWERQLVAPEQLPLAPLALLREVAPVAAAPSLEGLRTGPVRTAPVPSSSGLPRARRYALAALRAEQETVASMPVGNRNHSLNLAAYKLGGYVASSVLTEMEVVDALVGAAERSHYLADDGPQAALNTILSGLRAGMAAPRPLPD